MMAHATPERKAPLIVPNSRDMSRHLYKFMDRELRRHWRTNVAGMEQAFSDSIIYGTGFHQLQPPFEWNPDQ